MSQETSCNGLGWARTGARPTCWAWQHYCTRAPARGLTVVRESEMKFRIQRPAIDWRASAPCPYRERLGICAVLIGEGRARWPVSRSVRGQS